MVTDIGLYSAHAFGFPTFATGVIILYFVSIATETLIL